MIMKDTTQKQSIWVLYSDAPHGGYLFRGNPNQDIPPYHLGEIVNVLCGEELVWAYARKTLEMEAGILWWNKQYPNYRVKPKNVIVEIRPYYKRAKKEGGAK